MPSDLAGSRGLSDPAFVDALHCAEDELDCDSNNNEISDHLPGDHQLRGLSLARDIAEPDRGEDGNGEAQRAAAGQRMAEVAGRLHVQNDIGGGEQRVKGRAWLAGGPCVGSCCVQPVSVRPLNGSVSDVSGR